ncbi:hypothetical protein F5B22DRAFT_308113 [Xylaria bambusicola]|uniref:uncharacterized protein n=1 Tax=Xylaria bambusicola TaxID=326684 RepID=UPI0020086486|nr:uncharacterized protein F5B22DRAFT_308113 [Xylaria bambusicola]KAI0509660.1 hypothetical protein F5B22DRAFT_308113 [Xylaria bambusicola]
MDGDLALYRTLLKSAPQNPYLPRESSYGPSFLDSSACLCSLRQVEQAEGEEEDDRKRADSNDAAWQCIGNQTQGVYEVTTGKWFESLHGGSKVNLPIYDASNGPDTSKALTWDTKKKAFVDADLDGLTPYDRTCTAINQTTFSTSFYRALAEKEAGDTPTSAASCWRGTIPVEIQNVTNWDSNGCPSGFLCTNNTVNSLPQYCIPFTQCQSVRLSGEQCQFQGKNFPMGPFEPVICQEGYYCPEEFGGRKTLPCPAGTYCQPGAPTPTPCAVGSYCPERSTYQVFFIPLILLLALDVFIAVALVWYAVNKRFRRSREGHTITKPRGLGAFSASMTGYKELRDETDQDHEMLPMQATYMPPRADTWAGFQAALDIPIPVTSDMEVYDSGLTPELRAFVDSMRKATDASQFGLSFTYNNLGFHPKGSPKPILQNVTGSIERGSLTAVMGGSGAGKSTFVNVLMGKTTNTGGLVTVNNIPGKIKRYKKLIGYVPQDDIVLPELTVYENILHSARIRLPRTWSSVDIKAHVDSVIDCLELSHVRNSRVGSVGKPVISGGQRKRVSIGMELAAAPMAIFLDEPTSGLDATSASSIMRTLKAIARLGISVIVIIHQPRVEIFEMLDELILLGNGQIIYEGREDGVQQFFENVGFRFPEHANTADVITDIITGNGRPYKKAGDISKEALISNWANSRQNAAIKSRHESLQSDRASIKQTQTIQRSMLKSRGAPRWKQGWLCLQRAMLQQWRAKSTFWFEMGLASLSGILLGLAENSKQGILFKGIYNAPFEILSVATDIQSVPELALLTVIAIGLVSGAPGVKVFSEEMLLYRREAEAGHSRVAYFLAKNLSVFPRMAFACLHFTTLILVLSVPIMPWGNAFITNFVYFYCIYGLASVMSMIVKREDAPLFATMISLVVGILSGAAPPLSKVKEWHLEWLWRASPGTWLAEVYFGQMIEPFRYLYNVDLAARIAGFRLHELWTNILVLLLIGTIYRIIAFIGLVVGVRWRA